MMQLLDITTSDICVTGAQVWRIIGNIIGIVRIAIPIIIILLGTIDLGRAVIAGEDKQIKEAQHMLVRRVIYGVVIFFLVTIVQIVFGLVAGGASQGAQCFAEMEKGISFRQ